MDKVKNDSRRRESEARGKASIKNIQQMFFRAQVLLLAALALFLGAAGIMINIHFEREKRDRNLQNVAEAIARSPVIVSYINGERSESDQTRMTEYLDSLKDTLDDIDVISVVGTDGLRLYHSDASLTGTFYDGTVPDFDQGADGRYVSDETGPSGTQRRTYAPVYDSDGNYLGFVMAIMLMENIYTEVRQTILIFLVITAAALLAELLISSGLARRLKKSLLGYEPDVFTDMYQVRDNILESLAEGVIAVNADNTVLFVNSSALSMIRSVQPEFSDSGSPGSLIGQDVRSIRCAASLSRTLESGEKETGISLPDYNIVLDQIPILENGVITGAAGILHNRTEYTRLMEDLAGTRYLVDAMRANNHDFTNKLHVILGLLQMEMYDEASAYIQNITFVQRSTVSAVMQAVNEPALAALLIGKASRASELNIRFRLREGSVYSRTDIAVPSETLVTIVGNLIDNAFEAMDTDSGADAPKELLFGFYSRPGALLITVEDTGQGIPRESLDRIFENGYSTKGQGRGTGLWQVRKLAADFGGTVSVASRPGVGSSFSVSFKKKGQDKNV